MASPYLNFNFRKLEDLAELDKRRFASDEVYGTAKEAKGETSSPVQVEVGKRKSAIDEVFPTAEAKGETSSLVQGAISKVLTANKEEDDCRFQYEREFCRFYDLVHPVLRFDQNSDQLRQIFDQYQTYEPSGFRYLLEHPEKFYDYIKSEVYGGLGLVVGGKYDFDLLMLMIHDFITGSMYTNKIAGELLSKSHAAIKEAYDYRVPFEYQYPRIYHASVRSVKEGSDNYHVQSKPKFLPLIASLRTIKEGSYYSLQSDSEFHRFCASLRPVFRFDLDQGQLHQLRQIFDQYQTSAPSGFRVILDYPEKFHDYIKRELYEASAVVEKYDFDLLMVMIHSFMNGSIHTNKIAGSRLDVDAVMTSAGVHSFPLEQCSIDVFEKVSDHFLNNGTHDLLSQSNLDKLLVWFKENVNRDLAIRDPTLLKTLFGSDVFLSAGMISKYTSGSLPVEILQSLAIGSAIVGIIATATGMYLIFRQRRSSPFGFEREPLIQTLEDVGTSATGFAFVGGMSLLLPNNLSRCIVVGVLCAVVFLIIIFAKLRPEREAKTEPASSPGLASDHIKVAIELADLSETISSLGEC